MKKRPPRQEVQISQEVPTVFSRQRRPFSAQQQKKQEDYAQILQQQILEKEKLKAIQKQKEKDEELALEQKIQQAVNEEKCQQSKQIQQAVDQDKSQLSKQSNMRSSSASSKKDFRIKKSTIRCQSAQKKQDTLTNLKQELFNEQKPQKPTNYQAHENYLYQLQANLKELEIMRLIMEEEAKIQELKMQNQMVMNQYKRKQEEIQQDMSAFSKEMRNLQEIIKGQEQPLKKEIFEQSIVMSQVGVQNSLLNGSSKQMMISTNQFNKSYYKDLEKLRKQQGCHALEQTKEFSQVVQEFIYNNSKTPFNDEQMEESLPSVPKILDLESVISSNKKQEKRKQTNEFENEFL